jgi:chromosome segregation ATPase
MSFDLVQMQWQDIRSIEREQATEQLSIRLRAEIKQLRLQLDQASNSTAATDKMQKDVKLLVGKSTKSLRAGMQKLKMSFIKELNELIKDKQQLGSAFAKCIALIPVKDKQIKALDSTNNELTSKALELETQIASLRAKESQWNSDNKAAQQDSTKLQAVINRQTVSLKQEEAQRNLLKTELADAKSQYDSLKEKKDKKDSKFDVRSLIHSELCSVPVFCGAGA